MSAAVHVGTGARFTTGRLILLVAATLMTLNHVVLMVALDEPVLFLGFAAFTLYALVVIAIPFRRRQPWAWYATWILPAGLAAPAFGDPAIALFYGAAAAACVVGLLLTRRDVFAREER